MTRPARPRCEPLEDRTAPADGALDPTFGVGGLVSVPLDPAKADAFTGLAVRPDGKLVLTAAVTTVTSFPGPHGLPSFRFDHDMSVARTLPDGSLDPTFGVGGRVALPPYTTPSAWERTHGELAVQPDGKVVVLLRLVGNRAVVHRLTPDGGLDPTFGEGGRVLVQPSFFAGDYRLAVGADGAALVAAVGAYQVEVTRLTPAGAVDPTYGSGGTVRVQSETTTGIGAFTGDLVLLPDGGALVSWTPSVTEVRPDQIVVARLTAAGGLDPTFGTGGGRAAVTVAGVRFTGRASLAVDPSGRVLAAARFQSLSEPLRDGFAVLRLTAAGAADPAFGSGGVAVVPVGPSVWNNNGVGCEVAALRDGRVLVAGEAGSGYAAVRLTRDGQLDPTFGAGGVAADPSPITEPSPGIFYAPESREVQAVVVQPGGRIVFAGARVAPGQTSLDAELVGLTGAVPPTVPVAVVPLLVGGPADGTARVYTPAGGAFAAGPSLTFFPGFAGSVRTATADVTGDGVPDLIGGAGPGGGPAVAVIDGRTGRDVARFLAFEVTFTGGVYVAAGDIDGDGRPEVVVTPDRGGGPVVAVFGGTGTERGRFLGIDDPAFRGGARAALGDVNADGTPDLVVGAGFGGGPRVAVFDGKSVTAGGGGPVRLAPDFFAFEPGLRNGAFVAAGDADGDGAAEVAFGGGPGGAPRVRLFDGAAMMAAGGFTRLGDIPAAQRANFFAGDPALRGGVRVALRDAGGDGRADLVTGSGEGEPSRVRVYQSANLLANPNPAPDQDLDPFGAVLADGVFVG